MAGLNIIFGSIKSILDFDSLGGNLLKPISGAREPIKFRRIGDQRGSLCAIVMCGQIEQEVLSLAVVYVEKGGSASNGKPSYWWPQEPRSIVAPTFTLNWLMV